jgi:large subunit ribosomal protein L23
MALRDIFKKKKPKEIPVKPLEKPKEVEAEEVKPPQAQREKIIGEAYRILKTPQVTEKATDLVKKNQYVFKIWPRANKVAIKKAIEDLYGVDVISVKIINVPRKRRRLGRIRGWRKGYKKAIVKIKEGQKIEVLPR